MVLIVPAGTREKGASAFDYVTAWQWPKPQDVAVARTGAVAHTVAVIQAVTVEVVVAVAQPVAVVVAEESTVQ